MVSYFFTGEMTSAHECLVRIASDDKQFIVGSLFVLLMGFSLAFIPIILYPALSKHNKALALGYVIFRGAIETVTYIVIWLSMLLLVFASRNYVDSNSTDPQQHGNLVGMILKLRELSSLSTIFVFGIGALLLYIALYQARLIPRWLSLWGVLAIILYLFTGFLILFGLQPEGSSVNSYLSFPIFLQEMVMAIWLIAKGFNSELFEKQ
jgi:hypothetical protein